MSYEGKCVGGPWDGKLLANETGVQKLFAPKLLSAVSMISAEVAGAVELGEYRINDFGQWRWWSTEEGRAYEVLVSTISA